MMIPDMMPGLIMILVWFAMMAAMIGGYIILLIAVWRAMKAHESISMSLRAISAKSDR